MPNESSQRKPATEATSNIKQEKAQGANDPELQAESEAIDEAISGGLFLASRRELLKKEEELKHEKQKKQEKDDGGIKPNEA